MKLVLDGHDMEYETGNLCFLFFPGEKLQKVPVSDARQVENLAFTRLRRMKTRTRAFVLIRRDGRTSCAVDYAAAAGPKASECALGRAFYRAASRLCGFAPPWGILTGIRPAKLARELMAAGRTPGQTEALLETERLVTPQKARLCVRTARAEERIVGLSRPESVSLYIAIPFCPTRCLYCSFVSHDIAKAARLVPRYVDRLCEEIRATGRLVRRLGLRLETVYMGGGTPTSLAADDLRRIFAAVGESFPLDRLREYTVEAGRPDTITAEKLAVIREAGATRVCVNPQTLDDAVLRRIGRSHTTAQFYEAFAAARAAGIPSVNTDLIAGLPGDTGEGFSRTVRGVLALGPEGVTVHTLAMKRASRLVARGEALYDPEGGPVPSMLSDAAARLEAAGYAPYYLYRQRNSRGNLENVGWARPGGECLYNIFIMDETHSILAVGAGGVTKLRQPGGSRIERVFNFKYPYEYIGRFDEVLDRKRQVESFYDCAHRQDEIIPGTDERPGARGPGRFF